MSGQKKLSEMVSGFKTAMFVTHGLDERFQARPMAIAEWNDAGEIWFITDRNSEKVFEVLEDGRAAVTMQSSTKFVTLQGKCRLVDSQDQVERLWQESWRVWFPEGKEDDSIVLLRLSVDEGEFWDLGGVQGMKFLVNAGMAYVSGEEPEIPEASHSVVEFSS